MTFRPHPRAVFACLAVAGAILAAPAAAQERVAVDRAALGDPAAVAALYHRIDAAAHKVCRRALRDDLFSPYKMKKCVAATRAHALAEIDSPALYAYAEGRAESRRYAESD